MADPPPNHRGHPMTEAIDVRDPNFITVLADYDSHARWVARIQNTDTDQIPIDLLITLAADGTVTVATRPARYQSCSWAPPDTAERR